MRATVPSSMPRQICVVAGGWKTTTLSRTLPNVGAGGRCTSNRHASAQEHDLQPTSAACTQVPAAEGHPAVLELSWQPQVPLCHKLKARKLPGSCERGAAGVHTWACPRGHAGRQPQHAARSRSTSKHRGAAAASSASSRMSLRQPREVPLKVFELAAYPLNSWGKDRKDGSLV